MSDETEYGEVSFYPDGRRSARFPLPADWHSMTGDQQWAVSREVRAQLLSDSVAWNQDVPIKDLCECPSCEDC